MSDLSDALDSLNTACPGYNKAAAYAHGPINEVFASRRLKRLLKNKQVSFQTVLGGVVIGAVANKLKITTITTDNDAATAKLAEVDEHNKCGLLRRYTIEKTLESGDGYWMIWPEVDDQGEETGHIKIGYNDPRTVRVLYDPETPMRRRVAIQKWTTADKYVRVDLWYHDTLVHYRNKQPGGRATSEKDFELYTPEGASGPEEDNPHGIPFFHFSTTLPGEYGMPEHKPFYGTQDTLNKLKISHMGGVDYYGIPQRYALQEPGSNSSEAAELDEDEFAVSPDGTRTETPDGDGVSTLSSEPGSLWYMKGIKGFGQFDTADPKSFLDPAMHYLKEGATATATPLHLFPGTGDFPSGKALRTANAPLDDKAEARRDSFNATFHEAYQFVLKLLGFEDATVDIAWDPIQSMDEAEIFDIVKQKQDSGVPQEQTLKEAGYKGELVDRWMEDGEGGLPQRIGMLKEIATAIRDLTPAVTAGVVDKARVDELITIVMQGVNGDRAE